MKASRTFKRNEINQQQQQQQRVFAYSLCLTQDKLVNKSKSKEKPFDDCFNDCVFQIGPECSFTVEAEPR